MKASRAEAQAAEDAMLARATAASLADCSPSSHGGGEGGAPASSGAGAAADEGKAASDGKPPPEWFEIEEDDAAAAASPARSPGAPMKAGHFQSSYMTEN